MGKSEEKSCDQLEIVDKQEVEVDGGVGAEQAIEVVEKKHSLEAEQEVVNIDDEEEEDNDWLLLDYEG